jgi:hypothetical protein
VPALLINIRVDSQEKLDLFKVTLSDVAGLFEECHIKIRGRFAGECLQFAQGLLGDTVRSYQELQEGDWVAATLEMLGHIRCRSLFLYFEDHRLVASRQSLEEVLACFDRERLDYLGYSFFRASKLDAVNLLPLGSIDHGVLHAFDVTRQSAELIGRISPTHYIFSLVSLLSVEYFKALLQAENRPRKICSRIVNGLLARTVPMSRRRVVQRINGVLGRFGAMLCLYDPSSPFNLEKVWYDPLPEDRAWKYAIPTQELFANYDDDNGAYGESLIKKGLYPFAGCQPSDRDIRGMRAIAAPVKLGAGQTRDCTYHSHRERIRQAPVIEIAVSAGCVEVSCKGGLTRLDAGESKLFYSNLGPVVTAATDAEVRLRIFDEALQ